MLRTPGRLSADRSACGSRGRPPRVHSGHGFAAATRAVLRRAPGPRVARHRVHVRRRAAQAVQGSAL